MNVERQFSIEDVCEYFPNFSAQEIKDLRIKIKDGEVFNSDEAIVYLMYLCANNLYGWAMSQPLPVGNFMWLSHDKTETFMKYPEWIRSCTVEVDLEYPRELHDLHNDYPLALRDLHCKCRWDYFPP